MLLHELWSRAARLRYPARGHLKHGGAGESNRQPSAHQPSRSTSWAEPTPGRSKAPPPPRAVYSPDFGRPGQALGEVDPLGGGPQRGRRRWRLDDDVAVQGVHLALDAAVRVLGVLVLVSRLLVLEGVPLVVRVQAVLLHQGLRGGGDRARRQPIRGLACWL